MKQESCRNLVMIKGLQQRDVRRGSTLMIVMVLMGMLSLLGVIFYTFAAQERSTANFYVEAAKNINTPTLTADTLFDFALEQIIVGTDPRLTNSMLWGSRHSMLSNLLGYGPHRPGDTHPGNGQGVNVIFDANGNVVADQNRNGIDDNVDNFLVPGTVPIPPQKPVASPPGSPLAVPLINPLVNFVDSPAANNGQAVPLNGEDTNWNGVLDPGEDTNGNGILDYAFPQTDVGYTYPDINNVFLTYVGKVRDSNGNVHRIVKPAYLVPAILRTPNTPGTPYAPLPLSNAIGFEDTNYNGQLDAGEDKNGNGRLDDWCVNPWTVAQVMRGHPYHLYMAPNGSSGLSRYLTETQANSLLGATGHGFPFHPMNKLYDTTAGGAGQIYYFGRMGMYTQFDSTGTVPPAEPIEFDWDNDGDGIPEAILMDLDYPPQTDSTGKLFVPLFLITIHDLDSLINLNAHGNLAKILYGLGDIGNATTAVSSNTGFPFGWDTNIGAFDFVSKSNLGIGPSEVNPAWGLNARPPVGGLTVDGTGAGFGPHAAFYLNTPNQTSPQVMTQAAVGMTPPTYATVPWGETANMELTWIKTGRPIWSTPVAGQPQQNIVDLAPGVYGEEGLVYRSALNQTVTSVGGISGGNATLPRPGITFYDDNVDSSEGQLNPAWNPYFTVTSWDFQHPLDFTGQGTYRSASSPKTINWYSPGGTMQFIQYYHYGDNVNSTVGSYVRWGQNTSFMLSSLTQGLLDDPYEITYYPTSGTNPDNLFDPSETSFLQLSNSDVTNLGVTGRLTTLVPFNFSSTVGVNARGESIRHKFTTESNDRKNYSLPQSTRMFGSILLPAAAVRSGLIAGQEFSPDNVSVYLTPQTAPTSPSTGGTTQPFYGSAPDRFTFRFPPEFGNAATATFIQRYQIYQTGGTAADPFRPYVRAFLEMDNAVARSVAGIQQRLSVNKLLTFDPNTGKYVFRNLTAHPDDPGTAVVGGMAVPAYPPTSAPGAEYWARLDRQQLCRDIYVLLYLLGHGDDNVNTAMTSTLVGGNPPYCTSTTTPMTQVYSEPQMREMAQFAVNLVDAMDRDNVITRFEYDKDLSDGWNLDDDATTDEQSTSHYAYSPPGIAGSNYNVNYPNDSPKRGEVFGVESLDLTLNETLVINTLATATDNPNTGWTDTSSRNFAYVELFNRSPQTVNFNSSWQVVLKQDTTTTPVAPGFERQLILGAGAGSISSGSIYTICSADTSTTGAPGATGRSRFMVDPAATSKPISIAPTVAVAPPNGLDLVDEAVNGTLTTKAQILDQNGTDMTATLGSWTNGFAGAAPPSPAIRVILRRRCNLTRSVLPAGSANDNPWVDVDAMTFSVKTFDPTGTTATLIDSELTNKTKSKERPQPLDRYNENLNSSGAAPNYIYNSLTSSNSLPITPPYIWQPHFDREFASVGELLLVPVFAPYQLTMAARSAQTDSPEVQVYNTTGVGSPTTVTDWPYEVAGGGTSGSPSISSLSAKTAAAKFLVPEDPSNFTSITLALTTPVPAVPPPSPPTARVFDNRWHRLLEFLEVPTRTNSNLGIGTDASIPRVPGKMNLNMMRFPESLAALLDDYTVTLLNLTPSLPSGITDATPPDVLATMDDLTGDTTRHDWWQQFTLSRDGYEPYVNLMTAANVQIPLPGTPTWPAYNSSTITGAMGTPASHMPGSKPFRSFGDIRYTHALNGTTPVAHATVEESALRSLPADQGYPEPLNPTTNLGATPPQSRRRLLEIGTTSGVTSEHNSGTIDPLVRYRLMAKTWGNTTSRSNCFGVFISVKYFQAVANNGAIQIGGPYNGKAFPEHRGFFVVDRSRLEQGRTSNSMGYDFRAFVDYRKTLQTQ